MKFGPNGASSVFATVSDDPIGLAFDTQGDLFASLFDTNSIVEIPPGGSPTVFANTLLSGPEGLAFDGAGNLYRQTSPVTRLQSSLHKDRHRSLPTRT